MERSIYWSRLRLFTLCFLGVCSLFASSFSSADIVFTSQLSPYRTGSTLQEVCEADNIAHWGRIYVGYLSWYKVSTGNYRCKQDYINADATGNTWTVTSTGSGCTAPAVYDPVAIGCVEPEPDPCEPTIGQTIGNRVTMGVIEATGNKISYNDPPGVVCQSSCQYAWNGSHAARIYRFVEGLDNSIYGDYLYVGNGVSCSEAEETLPDQTVITSTEPSREKADSCSETVIDPQGGGTSQSCTSTDEYKQPGSLSCGQLNDKWVCTVGTPSPQAVKKTVTTETTKTDNPDGSKTEQKSIVTVVESCTAIKGCESKSSTKTETTGTGSDGTPSGGSSSCEGDLCTASGEETADLTDEELEPTCDPATDPNGCGQSSVSGDASCDATPVCQGDAVQCAILRQNHTARCDAEDAGDYQGKVSDIDALLSGPEFEKPEDDSIVDLSAIFTTGTRFLPSACPAAIPLNMASMGRTINIEFTWLCTFAEYAGYLLVAIASVFFIRYVGEAL